MNADNQNYFKLDSFKYVLSFISSNGLGYMHNCLIIYDEMKHRNRFSLFLI